MISIEYIDTVAIGLVIPFWFYHYRKNIKYFNSLARIRHVVRLVNVQRTKRLNVFNRLNMNITIRPVYEIHYDKIEVD